MSKIDKMQKEWESALNLIKNVNPSAKIVFTVSPVRHVKDGLVENNRSKARLLELVQQLSVSHNIIYFPSYEIVIDQLRDYRFFEEDMIHPNKQTIDFIWERFAAFGFSDKTIGLMEERKQLMMQLNHKSLHSESELDAKRLDLVKRKLKEFGESNPDVDL